MSVDVRVARRKTIEEHRRSQNARVRDAWDFNLAEAIRVFTDAERNVRQTNQRQL